MESKTERNIEILRLAREGYNRTEIAEKLNLTRARVGRICNEYNAPPAPRLRKATSDALKIAEQYRGILSPKEIGEITGLNSSALFIHGFHKVSDPFPIEKKCIRCGTIKSISEFTKDPRGWRRDKHYPICKECERIRHKEMYKRNPETFKQSAKRWATKNPEKVRAHSVVQSALKSGRLVKARNCEICQAEKPLVSHHWHGYDSEHQLDVQWICHNCHNGLPD